MSQTTDVQAAINRAEAKHPKLSGAAFNDTRTRFHGVKARSRAEMAEITKNIRSGVVAGHADGDKAWAAVAEEMRPKSIFEPVIKQVYDSEKGGWQGAGMIGGLLGLGAAAILTNGGSMGWEGLIALVLLPASFAWGANKLSEFMSKPSTGSGPAATPGIPTVQRAQERENGTVAVNEPAKPAPAAHVASMSYGETGTLSAPAAPNLRSGQKQDGVQSPA